MERTLTTLADLTAEAERFMASLTPASSGATLVTLSGELGAGKTAFAQEVARALGIEETVTSPTFVLEKIYALQNKLGHRMSKFGRLVHIDAYRLESGRELIPLGFDELMEDADNLILLEWPEKVADMLPEPEVRISMKVLLDGSHSISYG